MAGDGATQHLVEELGRALEQQLGGAVTVNVETVPGKDLRVNVTATLRLDANVPIEVKGYAIDHAKNPGALIAAVVGEGMKLFEAKVHRAATRASVAWQEHLTVGEASDGR